MLAISFFFFRVFRVFRGSNLFRVVALPGDEILAAEKDSY